eukprot:CAMPEP_0185494776 /NCGR_PEP_ID=MMETSP1366-20130426/17107_1 /TAXON_ID=38817 /ORGANISM="Gephyrocapsa oceanica, Strain RCC1303" /LENGTH=44 /DNA_ID= /DNA_START= /DNA_END= /DNA_ORIENTATION=
MPGNITVLVQATTGWGATGAAPPPVPSPSCLARARSVAYSRESE